MAIRIFHGFDSLPSFRHPAVTVGSYDGVHRGHQALIHKLKEEAQARGGETIVLTFDPHPRITLHRAEGLVLLSTLEEKARLLEWAGVDNLVVIPFDERFSALTGEEFVRDYLIGKLGAECLVAGYNHRFGHDRKECCELRIEGLKVVRVDACDVDGIRVSSTKIRNLIAEGNTSRAEELLGHPLNFKTQER